MFQAKRHRCSPLPPLFQIGDDLFQHIFHFLPFRDLFWLNHVCRRFHLLTADTRRHLVVHDLVILNFQLQWRRRAQYIMRSWSHWRFTRLAVQGLYADAPVAMITRFLEHQAPYLVFLDLTDKTSYPLGQRLDLSSMVLPLIRQLTIASETRPSRGLMQLIGAVRAPELQQQEQKRHAPDVPADRVLDELTIRGVISDPWSPWDHQVRTKRLRLTDISGVLIGLEHLQLTADELHLDITTPMQRSRKELLILPGLQMVHFQVHQNSLALASDEYEAEEEEGEAQEIRWLVTTPDPWDPTCISQWCSDQELSKGLVTVEFVRLRWQQYDFERALAVQPVAVWLICERHQVQKRPHSSRAFPALPSVKYVGLQSELWAEEEVRFVEVQLQRLFPKVVANFQWHKQPQDMQWQRLKCGCLSCEDPPGSL